MEEVYVKSVLNKHKRRDSWFLDDYSVNPYRMCELNCIYCYIRGSRYGGRGGLAAKVNAPAVLERELRRRARRGEYGFIALSSATEPWMPSEEKYQLTRRCLEVISRFRFPVHCLTKSTLSLRDLDLLKELSETAILPTDLKGRVSGVLFTVSISTLDEKAARVFEPRAPSPERRLDLVKEARDRGLQAGVAYIPVLPLISDSRQQLDEMAKAAREVDACYTFFGLLTLQDAGKELYLRVLEKHYPEHVEEYRKLYRRGWSPSREYTSSFYKRALSACRRYKLKFGPIEVFKG